MCSRRTGGRKKTNGNRCSKVIFRTKNAHSDDTRWMREDWDVDKEWERVILLECKINFSIENGLRRLFKIGLSVQSHYIIHPLFSRSSKHQGPSNTFFVGVFLCDFKPLFRGNMKKRFSFEISSLKANQYFARLEPPPPHQQQNVPRSYRMRYRSAHDNYPRQSIQVRVLLVVVIRTIIFPIPRASVAG